MNQANTPHPPAPSGDSRILLVIAGLLLILGGLGCGGGLATWMMITWQMMQHPGAPVQFTPEELAHTPPNMIMMAILYAGFGLGLAWLGVGCILTRRWAWKLALSAGWLWVLLVVTGVIAYAFIIPQFVQNLTALASTTVPSGGSSPSPTFGGPSLQMFFILLGVLIVVMFYLAPAIALIIVFGLKSTRVTCEFRDPTPRWTDAVPVPVLVLWLLFVTTAFGLVALAPGYWGLVPFTVKVDPRVSVPIWMLVLIALVLASRDLAAMRMRGWWLSLAIVICGGAAGAIMMQHIDPMLAYQNASIPEEQKKKMIEMATNISYWIIPAVSSVLITCYVFWLRRFFAPAPKPGVL
jgi:MFS family permease